MGLYPEIQPSGLLPPDTDGPTSRAAVLAVLARVDRGVETREGALTVLQALGLVDTPTAPRLARVSSRQRQQASRRVERAGEAS